MLIRFLRPPFRQFLMQWFGQCSGQWLRRPSSLCWSLALALGAGVAQAAPAADGGAPQLVRQRLLTTAPAHRMDVALTLDACSGGTDMELVEGLIRLRIPVTVFVTRKWLLGNPQAVQRMAERPEQFQFENHGAQHVPPVIGASVYGIRGVRDEAALREEVSGGTEAMVQILRRPARWYRGATAHYDARSLAIIDQMGYRIAGFSLNGDDGATLPAAGVVRRLSGLRAGDIVLAHMNHPRAGTGRGLLEVLPRLVERGFRFVRLSDAEGIEPLPSTAAPDAARAAAARRAAAPSQATLSTPASQALFGTPR